MDAIDAYINNFATRSFRDVADRDYISARMCYRSGLFSQFHWSALQAFEKYFKAILLYNRIKAKDVRHDLSKAQEYANKAPFPIKLSKTTVDLLNHLDSYGRFRYLETSYYIDGPKLIELDKAVWEVRRYCRVMDYKLRSPDSEPIDMLSLEIKRNEAAEKEPPQHFKIIGGVLEKILEKKTDPARPPLIWQNAFFGKGARKRVRIPTYFYAENAPLYLQPALLDRVLEYIYLPKEIIEAYRSLTPPA